MEINVIGTVVASGVLASFGAMAYFIRRAHKKNKWNKVEDPTPGPIQTFLDNRP